MAKQNTSSCVVGVQWGDEGKGKIVDILSEKADVVVRDLIQLLDEMDEVRKKGIKVDGRLFLSDRAHVVMPWHKFLDKCSEVASGKGKIGTTQRGIGPCYADKAARKGIRVADLYSEEFCKERVLACTA